MRTTGSLWTGFTTSDDKGYNSEKTFCIDAPTLQSASLEWSKSVLRTLTSTYFMCIGYQRYPPTRGCCILQYAIVY